MKHFFALIFAIYATFHLFVFNDYMHRQVVNVEVHDKALREDSKHRPIRDIFYQREDGLVFKRSVGELEWQTAQPGQKARLNLRPFDMKQTALENVRFFILPVIVAAMTIVYLLWFLICFGWTTKTKETEIGTSSGPNAS